jgi:peptide/nickel transport system permease protein
MKALSRKIFFYVLTFFAAVTINFFIPRVMPGNAVDGYLARVHGRISSQAQHALSVAFGVNTHQSIFGQYFSYLDNLAHFNLGISFTYFPEPVSLVIRQSLPWTLVLVGLCTVIAFVVGTILGIVAGWRRGSAFDTVATPIGAFLSSMPYFWFGLIAVGFFALKLNWFPSSGGYAPEDTIGFNSSFITSALSHAVLPALTIVASALGAWLLGMRNMMINTLGEDYVNIARAKGLSNRRVIFGYAARNAILPSVAGFALSIGFIVSGALLTEVVFSYPGIGEVLYQAISGRDYPLMQGVFLMITVAVLIANLAADVLYVMLDPRARSGSLTK